MQNEKWQELYFQNPLNHEVIDAVREAKEVSFKGFTSIVHVTPEMAEIFIKHNTKNRRISNVINERYARIMRAGDWKLNGEPVIFSDKGVLLDGQNRLMGILKSGVTVPMVIVYGIAEENFSTIDQGSKRTAGQVLEILECRHGNSLAAALRLAYLYFEIDSSLSSPSALYIYNEALLNFFKKHHSIEYSVVKASSGKGLCSPSALAFCHFVFAKKSQEMADAFLNQLIFGENLHAGDPILVLRNRLINNKHDMAKMPIRNLIGLIFKTWNYYRRTQKIKHLKLDRDEIIPEAL